MSEILKKVEEYIDNLFEAKLSPDLIYHSADHTKEVVKSAEDIGQNSGLTDDELEMLLIAAWFHDSGFVETYTGHEEVSVRICTEFLRRQNCPEDKIEKINSIIMATKVGNSPGNLIEMIIKDADLSHAGKKGFYQTSLGLRSEWEKYLNRKFTEYEWLRNNIDFLATTRFFTPYANEIFNERKEKNLNKLKKKAADEVLANPPEAPSEEIKEIIEEAQRLKEKGLYRGVETMFRNTIRTHVEFSGMADSKANIMISVNTLLLTAIVAILIRKLDSNPHLIIPTAIITLVSLTTLVYAIIVTRPKVTSGVFTPEDIANKRANLLFFGNFHKMDLKTFEWGMQEMIKDPDYLYGSMIKDLYYLGNVLGQKYKYLRICYNIFMYGFIISVIAFAIAVFTYPYPTELGPI